MKTTGTLLGASAASIALCALARVAHADPAPAPEPPPVAESPSPRPIEAEPPPPERGFLFAVDPSLPAPGHAILSGGMGNVSRTGEERPVGSGPAFPSLGGEVGLLPRLSAYAEGGAVLIQSGNPGGLASPFLLDAGFHILLTSPTSRTWHLSLRPSYGYDVTGASTGNLTATLGWTYRGFRVVTSVMGSHTFQAGADTLDLQATLGATYALPLGFRVGVEGVVADLEELATPEAEGGASAFAGPTAGWAWGRVQLVAGPAFGITPGTLNDSFLFRWGLSVRL